MKKIILFIVVIIALTTTIFVISCKKENNTVETKKVSTTPVTNNGKGLIIDESNYKDYLYIQGVEFFFKVKNSTISHNGAKVKYVLSAVNGRGVKQSVTFDSWDAACKHATACNNEFPGWWTNWEIDGSNIDCPCFKINCYAK